MQTRGRWTPLVLLVLLACGPAAATNGKALGKADALGKVIELLDALRAKIESDYEKADKAYRDYYGWCDETAANKANEISQFKAKKDQHEATITKSDNDAEASEGKISDLATKIKRDTQDTKKAGDIRAKEAEEFKEAEAELMETDDILGRAIGILEKEMEKNPAAFAQVDMSSFTGVLAGLETIVDAAGLPSDGKSKLLALVQANQQGGDGDGSDEESGGAPDPTAYGSHSAGIVDVLEDMKEKAQAQLKDIRKTEANQQQYYKMLTQGLDGTIEADTKSMADEKRFLAETKEAASVAKKELVLTTKALQETTEALKSVQEDCMRTATNHEASTEGRKEELKVIAQAKKVLQESMPSMVQEQQQPASFLQTAANSKQSMLRAATKHSKERVARLVKELAKEHHSAALAQLASRIAATEQYGAASGEDPFAKVKGMISDMIAKLEREAKEAAQEKAYCDEQMSKTEEKKEELESDRAKLTATIDTKMAQSTDLKKQVTETQAQIAKLAQEQVKLDKIRADEHAAYEDIKAELEKGLYGVKKALKILRKYYGAREEGEALLQGGGSQPMKPVMHKKSEGAGGSIMDILEVVEADLAKNLAEVEQEESDADGAYTSRTQEIRKEMAFKQKDVQYKTQESKGLDQAVNEQSETRDSAQEELDAVLEYYAKVKERCVAKPDTFEQRAARREAEIEGLQRAQEVLSEEVALLQASKRARLRRTGGTALAADF